MASAIFLRNSSMSVLAPWSTGSDTLLGSSRDMTSGDGGGSVTVGGVAIFLSGPFTDRPDGGTLPRWDLQCFILARQFNRRQHHGVSRSLAAVFHCPTAFNRPGREGDG